MMFAPEKNLPIKYFVIALFLFVALQTESAERVVDRELTVIRGDFKEIHYLVPETIQKSELRGSFTCKGGFYDDINFYVFTKDQYVRWYSHYPHKSIFKLEKKKEGKFEIPVIAGETYYFVFDNFFSTVSNKQVKLQVTLIPSEK